MAPGCAFTFFLKPLNEQEEEVHLCNQAFTIFRHFETNSLANPFTSEIYDRETKP